jgi:hypothetical protein
MPLQNRVDPWGNILAVSARGAWLGNRGIIHNVQKQIVRPYQHQSWVTCRLRFKNRKRKIMSPSTYTELFFLDESTAFAAGHRPCGECRRERYRQFKELWVRANLKKQANNIKVSVIDSVMHKERINKRVKVKYKANIKDLPSGTMFSTNGSAYLVYDDKIYYWSFEGYRLFDRVNFSDEVDVLTPLSIVITFKMGFLPEVHDSVTS